MRTGKTITGTVSRILMSLAMISCSIREDRTECPCYLDIALMRQSEQTFVWNKAWCSVWNAEKMICSGLFSPVVGIDGIISSPVPRNRIASVVVSNIEQSGGRISVESGSQMAELYISRKDTYCVGDAAIVGFDSFCKQYVNMTFLLNEKAYPYRDSLRLAIDGPYDGISLPSMKPHAGVFRYVADFNEEGKVQVRISPQGGPGLKVGIQLGNNPPAVLDLYRAMLDADFDWKENSLTDFEITLGLNTVSGIIQIVDWNIIQLEDIKY